MAASNQGLPLVLKKLGGIVALVAGFLVAASGYRSDSIAMIVFGIVLILLGAFLLFRKIEMRNRP
ncbi:hypothetical protein NDN16_08970 [Aureimonas altamirensis]|uniref:hypothetical protein n=1 Tax=Aureimonas altamirensis TaxID=370622 RepID=UPI002036C3D4|nr:hypothetical protein [Aureimonas altamirensis]MCM2503802.1 hypothetical protein [Aureimonas altamirensis]